ncbi:dihydrofolate reductase family protein [Spongiactinospora sp. TRM90649]|uniref:dihydrofolate reductase family protein n=1 Tax=Spongiactinospora sp. TRM90649 TaxID=3031114 RepID=UPI0023F8F837|nr:dihydrofolate reductase family protein [Spongiactinospora sp. TRM90649]MDF5757573.1 dihydrofolate reductase family protein [Spongiactinospora sp. TRM90649]
MRKIISGLFISLDGVVEAPDQWHFPYFDEDMGNAVQAMMNDSEAMLLGRRTYEEFAGYWPTSTDDLAGHMNGTPKYVVSNTLTSADWQNSTLVSGDVVKELARIKEEPGGNLAITGSGTLVASLLRAGLLDELHLLVHPIVVGSGKRLFEDGAQVPLRLTDSTTFSTGVLHLVYGRADS